MTTKYNDDPFEEDPFAEQTPPSEEAPQPPEEPQVPQEQGNSVEAISKILREKAIVRHSLGNYTVITEISKIGRKWCYDCYALVDGKKIDELILPSEYGTLTAQEGEEAPPNTFFKRASQIHLVQCENVQKLIEEETRKTRKRKKRKFIKVLSLFLLVALIAGGSYLFIRIRLRTQQDSPVGGQVDTASDFPSLSFEYTTIRGKIEPDEHGIPTIILQKTDVVTINVVDPNTGEIIAQDVINIELAEEP